MTIAVASPSLALTRRGLLGAGAGLAVGVATSARAADGPEPLVVYAVRHCEKQAGDDPLLTEAGVARADQLAAVLRDVPLRAVLSTDTRRTRRTAEPTARGHGLETTVYRPEAGVVARSLGEQGGAVLVVGHSNTIPALLRELGAEPPLAELEGFDDLFVALRFPGPAGAPRALLQRLHYGAPSAAGGAMR